MVWKRNSIGDLLLAIVPFLKGFVMGEFITGLVVCGPLGKYVIGIADIPHSPFDAFVIWLIFGLPVLALVTSVWESVVLIVIWLVCPMRLVLRLTPNAILVLGIVAAIFATLALTYQFQLGAFAFPIGSLAVVMAPLLLLKRDTDRE